MEARGRARTLAALAVVAWIAYEIVMAWRLRDTFTVNDWLALAWKLVYLTGLLAAVALGGLEVAARYAALESTILAALVRASHGWLSYTWFTVLVPAIGVAASLHLYRRRVPLARAALAYNLAGLAYFLATLWGRAYQAPEGLVIGDMVALLLALAARAYMAWRYRVDWKGMLRL